MVCGYYLPGYLSFISFFKTDMFWKVNLKFLIYISTSYNGLFMFLVIWSQSRLFRSKSRKSPNKENGKFIASSLLR